MKFTHRVAGPKKGNGSCLAIKVRKPPKAAKVAPVSKLGKHLGPFAKIADVVRVIDGDD